MNKEERYTEGIKRFELARLADYDQRNLAIEDLLFINAEDGQWEEDLITKRQDRPRYTIDRISGAINQIIGDQRQTRTGIKVEAQKDGEEKTAEIYTGLIRSIEQISNANNAYDNAFYEQLICGFGGWRITTEWDGEGFEQKISIKPILSAASSLFFGPSEEYDKRDASHAFLISRIPFETFKEKYTEASVTDFSSEIYKAVNTRDWFGEEGVRIAEYWYKKPATKTIGLMSDGRVLDLKEEKEVLDELVEQGIKVQRERKVESFEVEMVIMNGAEILTEPQKWAGKYIPLVPLFGITGTVDNQTYIRGKVRKAKDAQRIYNYAISQTIETTALTPKDPYWITATQAEGYEKQLNNFNVKNNPFMLYKPDPLVPGPPTRGGAPQLQQALIQQTQQAADNIYATTEMAPPSLGGSLPELKSGKAINAEQSMGDRGSYVYQNNLEKSLQFEGDILVDILPRTYDTKRVVKVLGPDETLKDVTINDVVIDSETGKEVIVNDLSQGTYSVSVKSGPSFTSKRAETVTQLVTLAGQSPEIQELALDLIIDNMDLNKGEEIKSRVRKNMIKKGIVEPTEEEQKEMGPPPPPDPMQTALVDNLKAQTDELGVKIEKLISETKNKDADTQQKIMAAQKDAVSAWADVKKILLEQNQAGIPLTESDIDTIEGQTALVQETQEDVLEGQELAESVPLNMKGQPMPQEMPQEPQQQPEITPEMINEAQERR